MKPVMAVFVFLFSVPLLAQQPLPDLPPMQIDIQETIPATPATWDTIGYYQGQDNIEIANKLIYLNGRAAIKTNMPRPPNLFKNWFLHDLEITAIQGQVPFQGPWGIHRYGMDTPKQERLHIHDLLKPQDSHGIYDMVYGGWYGKDLRIVNTYGQAVQLHYNYRADLLSSVPEITETVIQDSEFVNNCQGGMGGSAVTIRGEHMGMNVLSQGNLYWQSFPNIHGWGNWRAKGGLIAYGSHYPAGHAEAPLYDPAKYSYNWVVIRGDNYFFDRADRPIIRVQGAKYVIIEGNHVEEVNAQGYGEVLIDTPAGRPSPQYVLIKGNTSGAVPVKVRINGQAVGVITDTIEWGTPPDEPNPFGDDTNAPTAEDLLRKIAELDQRLTELGEQLTQSLGREQALQQQYNALNQYRGVLEERIRMAREALSERADR